MTTRPSFPRTTRAEMETLLRFDEEERLLWLETANPTRAAEWHRLGFVITPLGRYPDGTPRSWSARGPVEALRLRRVCDGKVVKRPAPRTAFQSHRGRPNFPPPTPTGVVP